MKTIFRVKWLITRFLRRNEIINFAVLTYNEPREMATVMVSHTPTILAAIFLGDVKRRDTAKFFRQDAGWIDSRGRPIKAWEADRIERDISIMVAPS